MDVSALPWYKSYEKDGTRRRNADDDDDDDDDATNGMMLEEMVVLDRLHHLHYYCY